MQNTIIRKAEDKDWAKIPNLMKALREHVAQYFPLAEWESSENSYINKTRKTLNEKEGSIYVVEIDEVLCGLALGWVVDDSDNPETHPEFMRKGHIEELFIVPEYREKGLGRALLATIVKDLQTKNISHISLGVLQDNAGSIEFYKKCGFESYFIHMKKDLKSNRPHLGKSII